MVKILLVDDSDEMRGSAREILERSGYVVIEARDGKEGLVHLLQERDGVDVMLTDDDMPKMDGFVLAKRAKELRPGLRVIVMIGGIEVKSMDQVAEGVVEAVDIFMAKPFNPNALLSAIKALCG